MEVNHTVPKPHDPRQLAVTPAHIDDQVREILAQEVSGLEEEVAQLDRAHEVLRAALQES